MQFRPLNAISLLAAFLLCSACGGGGSGPGSGPDLPSAIPSIAVDWQTRFRTFIGPTSALSVRFALHDLTGKHPDVQLNGNDDIPNGTASQQIYSLARAIPLGPYRISAAFYAGPNQQGPITATANVDATLFLWLF